MKKFILFILLIFNQFLHANMASPIILRTIVTIPFTSQYVDILSENIFISVNHGFESANYEIEYKIRSSAKGVQIPLLFYAIGYQDKFKIYFDGKEIELKDLPNELISKDGKIYSDFEYFFKDAVYHEQDEIFIEEMPGSKTPVNISNLKYFETDIPEGEHIITVRYLANSWINTSDWVNEYSFRYALSPAKYWKSFGELHITLDASKFDGKIITNLPNPLRGSLDSIAVWKFTELPNETIELQHIPEIKPVAKALIKLTPVGMTSISGVLLLLLHIILIIRYRNQKMDKRFSPVMIIGSLTVPLLILVAYILSFDVIDLFIGPGASGRHGYIFMAIFLYPLFLPFYFLAMWLTDRIYRRNKLKIGG